MARTYTIGQIKQRIRKRADMISASGFYPDADLLDVINECYAELYDTLVDAYQNWYSTTANLTLIPGTVSYALPADHYKLIAADRSNPDGTYSTIFPYNELERNSTLNAAASSIPSCTVRLRYIPNPIIYTNDAQTVDGVSGWDALLVTDAAIALLESEESDTGALEKRRQRLMARINQNAQNRDVTMPGRITDITVYDNTYIREALRYRLYGNTVEFMSVSFQGAG